LPEQNFGGNTDVFGNGKERNPYKKELALNQKQPVPGHLPGRLVELKTNNP
jgi:hypothetical protein